jgi:integrase/recombinase XerD
MREAGLKETGCNAAIRAINSYLNWHGSELRIPQLKEPQFILPTFSLAQVTLLLNWKPKNFYDRRLHLLVMLLLDTGARISEACTLRIADLDMENLLVTLDGKGRKQRLVPISFEFRKAVHRYLRDSSPSVYLLEGRTGKKAQPARDAEISEGPLHSVGLHCSDTDAARIPAYVRGELPSTWRQHFSSAKVLGHSSLEMTRRYANLLTDDLSAIHERVSLLSR